MAEERSHQLDVLRALGLTAVIFQHTFNPHGRLTPSRSGVGVTAPGLSFSRAES